MTVALVGEYEEPSDEDVARMLSEVERGVSFS